MRIGGWRLQMAQSADRPASATSLNDTHKRVLRNVLLELDHAITTAESLLQDTGERGVLYGVQCNVAPERRDAVRAKLAQLRGRIQALAAQFGLPAEHEDAARQISSLMSLLWTHLEDVRPRRLKAYGPLPMGPETDSLDAQLSEMIDAVLAIVGLVSHVTEFGPGH